METYQKHVLSVHNLYKTFAQGVQDVTVLRGINATFVQGESYAIMGISGSGKSTFVQLLAGLDDPTSGEVCFDDKDITDFTRVEKDQFLNKSIGLVFQQSYLIQELSVAENVCLPGLIAGETCEHGSVRAMELLNVVGLAGYEHVNPSILSGGQQQRVALARALYNKPAFLIADEPTGSLDKATGMAIIDLLYECQKEWGMGLIISTHDTYVAQRLVHHYRMIDGVLHQQGV